METHLPTTPSGRPPGRGPFAFPGTQTGKMVAVLVVAAGIIGAVYFFSHLQPVVADPALAVPGSGSLPAIDSTTGVATAIDSIIRPDDLPGFEIQELTNAQRLWLYHQAHGELCSCDCGFTVADCRVEDLTCPVSPGRAQELVEEASRRQP